MACQLPSERCNADNERIIQCGRRKLMAFWLRTSETGSVAADELCSNSQAPARERKARSDVSVTAAPSNMQRNAAGTQGLPLTSISALSWKNQTPCLAACLSAGSVPAWTQSRSTSRSSARIFSRSVFVRAAESEGPAKAEEISIMGILRAGFASAEAAGGAALSLKSSRSHRRQSGNNMCFQLPRKRLCGWFPPSRTSMGSAKPQLFICCSSSRTHPGDMPSLMRTPTRSRRGGSGDACKGVAPGAEAIV